MILQIDDLGNEVALETHARRIVCLVPSITETLFALGAGDLVAGVTDFCIHPADGVRVKEKVGGTKNARADRIAALQPDLVIANPEENRKHLVEQLKAAGLRIFLCFPRNVAGCLKMVRDMGRITGACDAAEAMVRSIEEARAEIRRGRRTPAPGVLCPIWKNPWMSCNRDTFVDSIIGECGGRNVFHDSAERYPVFDMTDAAARLPEVILLPTEPYRFTEADRGELLRLGGAVPAVRDGRIHVVEGELLSWYGPRVVRALREIAALL